MEINGVIERKLRLLEQRLNEIKKLSPRNSSIENFQELEKLKVIQSFDRYADMVRFRNFVVHRYENIDTQILFTIITKKINDFSAFVDEIRDSALVRE